MSRDACSACNAKKLEDNIKSAGILLWLDSETIMVGYNPKKGWMEPGGKRRDAAETP